MVTLRSIQSSANNENSEASLTWRAINSLCQSSGSPSIDFDRFSAQWDTEGEGGILHQLVSNFDQNGVTLKTDRKQPNQHSEKTGMLKSAAKRAALKRLKK